MKTLTSIYFLLWVAFLNAQNPRFSPRHDNVWLMGYDSYGTSLDWGGTRIDFLTNPPTITREDRYMDFDISNGTMSDVNGALLFYTNAYYIANALNDTMLGGFNLNPNPSVKQDANPQGVLILPDPDDSNKFYLIHVLSTFDPTPYSFHQIYHCLYSKIDMQGDNGRGEVVAINKVFLKDTLCYGKLTACKHANGRDWWILIPKWNSALYFTYLLTPTGLDFWNTKAGHCSNIECWASSIFSRWHKIYQI
ncbi:MAG: hypothetical protein IPM36_07935 [Lewinellaceae bacterium]|nr:hypothetical protein [Lewinellaceae bacterium]